MKKPFYKTFYAQVLIAVTLGLAVGALYPTKAAETKHVEIKSVENAPFQHAPATIKEWRE